MSKKLILSLIVMVALIVAMSIVKNSPTNVVRIVIIAFLSSWVVSIGLIVKNAKKFS